jgi:hypothetical protein
VEEVMGWFLGRIPDEWLEGTPDVSVDREEILVVGRLPDVEHEGGGEGRAAARRGRITRFREETREQRIRIAQEAERRFRRKVSWGAQCGDVRELFTTLSMPVMTRLRQPERSVLDTLVEAGVARSRSHALAWCVRLVGQNQKEWIQDLRSALVKVGEVRGQGPA